MCYIGSPGHATKLQVSVPMLTPTQSAPPPCGLGFVQVLVRVCEPTPQVTEQLLQGDHCDQLPSAINDSSSYYLVTLAIYSLLLSAVALQSVPIKPE